jgi:hypothetical protein
LFGRGITGDRGAASIESRSMAEARALGLKTRLFPNYRDAEKPDAQKETMRLEKAESQSKSAEISRNPATARVVLDAERRDIQKPKNCAENPNAGKKDVQKDIDKNIAKTDIVKGAPIPDEPDSHS